jgi:hypothetical protein
MNEKTLLYGALAATAAAAVFGVIHAHESGSTNPTVAITPVSIVDANNTVSQAEVPIRLTASDGTGLKLTALSASAAVEDPLALTELHLTFENPEDRILEGTFRITLPQGASLSRFAMKVGGAWQEGEVVEKQAARQAYEDFLHRRQDPALMEQGAGNEFSARVFPIPARGTKEIIIAYSEVLEGGAPYVLPLRGLPQLGTLDVDVHAAGGHSNANFGVHQRRFTPGQDFVVEGKLLPRSAGLRSGNLALTRVIPFASSRPEPVASAIVLVDTSASRGLGLAEQAKLVKNVLAKLPGEASITVACFDQDIETVYKGKASGFGDKETQAIIKRDALGASDFEQAIGWAAEEAKRGKQKRVILVGDGVATEGETDALKLHDKVQALRDAGVDRMDAIAVGGIRDDGFLRTVVRGVLDRDGVVLDGKLGPDALARRLSEATSSGVPVKVEGAKWSWPEKLDGLQAGDEVMVYAEMDDDAQPVKVSIGTQQLAPDLKSVERPLLERAWAQAKIQSLIEAPTDNPATTKQKIIALSTRNRVLSPYTALLVLETEWDYRRFGIDRNATVDILTVQDGRVAVLHSSRDWEERQKEANLEQRTAESKAERSRGAPATAAAQAPLATATATTGTGAAPAAEPSSPAEDTAAVDNLARRDAPRESADETTLVPQGGAMASAAPPSAQAPGADVARLGEAPAAPPPPPAMAARPSPRPAPTAAPDDGDLRGGLGLLGTGEGGGGIGGSGNARGRAGHVTNGLSGLGAGHGAASPARTENRVADGTVRPGTLLVQGGIGEAEVQRVLRGANSQMHACYTNQLARNPSLHGRATANVVIDALGNVKSATATSPESALRSCTEGALMALHFPAPGTGDARFTASFDYVSFGGGDVADDTRPSNGTIPQALPYEGRFKIVMEDISRGEKEAALVEATKWHHDQPGDVLALVALGEASEARDDAKTAARAYGSILELFSFRADSRRFAGERLERLADASAIRLAIDTYKKAVEERPDHPASHRLYAYALLKHGEYEKAFDAIKKGASRSYPAGRFAGVDRILREDMGLVAAAWEKAEPARAGEIAGMLRTAGGTVENTPSLRFVLNWETDANDVDFHIHDGKGGHAYYASKQLPSGGELYADVTTGYGPECFTIRGPREARAYPYTLQAHYYSRGPMGYGMGKLEIIDHDGKGNLTFEERPFVVMVDRAYVDMGTVTKAAPAKIAAMK